MLSLFTTLAEFDPSNWYHALIVVCVAGVIFWILWWLITYLGLPEPFAKVARAILAIAAVIILIGILLEIAGYPVFRHNP